MYGMDLAYSFHREYPMPRSHQTLMETETLIRFDETDYPAILWTASPRVRREWESWGFEVKVSGDGWGAEVPKNRISYKPVKKQAQK